MEVNEIFEQRKAEITQEMQVLKDKFLDDILLIWQKRMQDFAQDWNKLASQKATVEEKQAQNDRLNK